MMKLLLLATLFLFPCHARALGLSSIMRYTRVVKVASPPAGHFDVFSIVGSTVTSWYRADSGLSPTTPGDTITSWNDLSATANHLTTIAGTPKVSTTTQNGLPMVRCYGDTNYLMGTDKADTAQPTTIFMVVKPTTWNANKWQKVLSMQSGYQDVYRLDDRANLIGAAGAVMEGPLVTNNVTQLWTVILNGNSSSAAINGDAASGGTAAGTNTNTNYPVVCNREYLDMGFVGYIAEILIYRGTLSAPDLAAVKAGLNSWWTIY